MFLFSNISLMNQYLILGLKRKNPQVRWFLFEDGASTYSSQVGGLVLSASPKVRMQLYAVQKLSGVYLFHPEELSWKAPCRCTACRGSMRRRRWLPEPGLSV